MAMQVVRLATTPVKGLGLHHPEAVRVSRTGVSGDRAFYLVDDRDALFSIAKTGALVGVRADYDESARRLAFHRGTSLLAEGDVTPGEPHVADFFGFKKVSGHRAPGPWDEALSDLAGRQVRLVMADHAASGHDVEPLTLLGSASVRRLSSQAGVEDVDARRFRMLIEFDGAAPHAEDGWDGRLLQAGTVVAQVGGPVQRCAGTTRHPDSGQVDLKTLALIGDYRGRQDSIFGLGFNFGVYASVVEEGVIALGDALTLLD